MYYFFDGMIDIKHHGPNKIKVDHISYVTPNRVKPLHLIIGNTKGFNKESYENKYLTLFHTNERRNIYGKIWKNMKQNQRSY